MMVDALGWPRDEKISCKPVPGNSLELTIDFEMQMALDRAIEGDRGAAVLLDVSNGDILAMSSYPGFDPNLFTRFIPASEWSRLKDKKRTPLVNRALEGEYQPGSTFKVVSGCAALKYNVLNESTNIGCVGKFSLGNRVAYCWKPSGHGNVQFREALCHSCNVYFYTIGSEIDAHDLGVVCEQFGLGHRTGICLKHERTGIVCNEEWRKTRKKISKAPWTRGDTVNSAIGQGDILVTPLQMARVAAAISNGGKIFRPRLVKRILTSDGELVREVAVEEESDLSLTPDILEPLRDGMKAAVQSGTAWRTRVKGVTVLGKTGSAQNPGRKTHAWFIGVMETYHPSVAIAVLLENAGAGGAMAAPVAKRTFDAVKEIIENRQIHSEPSIISTLVEDTPAVADISSSGTLSVPQGETSSSPLSLPLPLNPDDSEQIGVDPDEVEDYEAGEDELYVGTI